MAVIFKALSEQDVYERYGTAIDLLHWVLVRLRDPYIKSIKKESVSFILYIYIINNYINFIKFFFIHALQLNFVKILKMFEI